MRVTRKPIAYLFPGKFGRLQFMNAVIWGATIIGAAIAAKASDQFIYVLLVLFVGFNFSSVAVDAAARRSEQEAEAIMRDAEEDPIHSELRLSSSASVDRVAARHSSGPGSQHS